MSDQPKIPGRFSPRKTFWIIILRSGVVALIATFLVSSFVPAAFSQHLLACTVLFLGFCVVEFGYWTFVDRPTFKPWTVGRFFKSFRLFALLFLFCVLVKYLWMSLMLPSPGLLDASVPDADIMARRAFLIARVGDPSFGAESIPPIVESPFREELAIASLSMTATAITNIAFRYPETRAEAAKVLRQLIETMLRDDIRRYEVIWWGHDALEHLEGGKGQIGYLGHLNLMLGAYRLLGGGTQHDELHTRITLELNRRLRRAPGFHVDTFPGAKFTADNTLVYATLAHYDVIFGDHNGTLISDWISYTNRHLEDPETGMVVYHTTALGKPLGTPRGVLQGWNSMWLPFADKNYAKKQYQLMKKHLRDRIEHLELGGVREYPRGKSGPTDIIAGPIVLGVSGAATGFAIGGATWWDDEPFLVELLRTGEFVGSTLQFGGKRLYLFSPLVGDAIVLAARTMTTWDDRFLKQENPL